MYAVTVLFRIKEPFRAEFAALMRANAQASLREEPGCRRFDVCSDPERPGEVFLYELYDDPAAFRAHLTTAHFRDFDARTAGMVEDKQVQTFAEVVK